MGFTLRPYQVEEYDAAKQLMLEHVRRIVLQAPTGSGKTALAVKMFESASGKGMDCWFIVHRRELIRQSSKAFDKAGIKHAFIASGFIQDLSYKVQVCSIGTLVERFEKMKKYGMRVPQMVVWDECHHVAASTWARIQALLPNAFHIGLTATPWRLNGEGLDPFFDRMIAGPQTSELIEMGYLSPYVLFKPKGQIDTKGIKTRMGEWVKAEVSRAADKPLITGNAIREYLTKAPGKKGIIFAASVEHSLHVCADFNYSGVRAMHVDAKTPDAIRSKAMRDLEEGKLDLLSNVNLFGEGVDVPTVEVVIDLSPSQSRSAVLQRWGRALRPVYKPGLPLDTDEQRRFAIAQGSKPRAFILDHAGNSLGRHGLPDDFRTWSLKGGVDNLHSAGANGSSNKLCHKCNAALKAGAEYCYFCGTKCEIDSRKVEEIDGELEEVDVAAIRAAQNAAHADMSLDELIQEGISRGYTKPEVYANGIFNKFLESKG